MRVTRLASLALVSMVLSLNVADLQAGQELKIVSAGENFYCLFDASCAVTITETTSTFALPNTTGNGILYSRTFAASPGSPAEGAYGYEYQIDLEDVETPEGLECIDSLRIKLGAPLATLDYDGDGVTGDQVFTGPFFGPAGEVNFLLAKAVRDGPFVTFYFAPPSPVCPFGTSRHQSVSFGVLAAGPPKSTLAELELSFTGGMIQTGARGPNLAAKASYKATLLYDTIATLPPGGFIAPSLNAGEGHRQAMLNRVNAALKHVEEDRFLPAVQLLQQLLLLTDGDGDDWVQDDPETRVHEQMNLLQIIQETIEALEEAR